MRHLFAWLLVAALLTGVAANVQARPYTNEEVQRLPEMVRLIEQIRFDQGTMSDRAPAIASWERAGYMLGQQAQYLGNDLERIRRFSAMRDAFERAAAVIDFFFGMNGQCTEAFERGLFGVTPLAGQLTVQPVFAPLAVAGPATAPPPPAARPALFDGSYEFRGRYGPVEQRIDVKVSGGEVNLRVINAYGVEGKVFDFVLGGGKIEPTESPTAYRTMVGYSLSGNAYDAFGNVAPVNRGDWRFAQVGPNVFQLTWNVVDGDFGGFVRFGSEDWQHGATDARSSIMR